MDIQYHRVRSRFANKVGAGCTRRVDGGRVVLGVPFEDNDLTCLGAINKQIGLGQLTTPKGRTRRTVPMTDTLLAALKALDTIRTGFVIRNLDGSGITDNATKYHCYRLCRAAGLPEHGWHIMRHAFGTHAAMFGVNPWKLMQWMGHKRVDETMLYVHFAEAHMRPHLEPILEAQRGHDDPDQKIIAMLDARRLCWTETGRGKTVAKPEDETDKNRGILVS